MQDASPQQKCVLGSSAGTSYLALLPLFCSCAFLLRAHVQCKHERLSARHSLALPFVVLYKKSGLELDPIPSSNGFVLFHNPSARKASFIHSPEKPSVSMCRHWFRCPMSPYRSVASNSSPARFTMDDSIKIVSKGVMMGAAITFTAIRREHTFYSCVALSLFSLATMAHVAMCLSPTTLRLYALTAILIQSALAIAVIARPQFVFVPILGYAPVLIAFMLWIIEDCSRFSTEAPCLLPWGTANIDREPCAASTLPTVMHGSRLSFRDSIDAESKVDDDRSTISAQDSLLFRLWGPSQSYVPSSRMSDISLSSSRPESLPSSWGTLTRIWFSDFSAQGQNYGEPSHIGCQRSRTV
ncbi:hypothetical protein F5B21DRAFT_322749 [Xylaria acuta]|nr:hypothetical protein F5B21DRAFT_322749 [Xylaria acuta]